MTKLDSRVTPPLSVHAPTPTLCDPLVGRCRAWLSHVLGWRTPSPEELAAFVRDGAERAPVAAVAGDLDRARAFFVAWDLQVTPRVYDDMTTPIPTAEKQADAVQALAQAFADERRTLGAHVRAFSDDASVALGELGHALERDRALLRRAVGVVSDLHRLEGEVRAVLDGYAGVRTETLPPKVGP